MTTLFSNPFRENLKLNRYPLFEKEKLQAWDAADELILDHLKNEDLNDKKILILNDSFGALSLSLENFNPTSYTDSFVSYKGMIENGLSKESLICDLNDLLGDFDYILIKLPKNMSFFEDLLFHIKKHSNKKTKIIVSSMIKHLPKAAFDLLNKILGETSTSLAKKKARLIFTTNESKEIGKKKYPIKCKIDKWPFEIINHSNVFSREKLDIGTRFFLDNINETSDDLTVLDLGCGNGLLGINAKKKRPNSKIIFTDDSYMAIKSAKENYRTYFPNSDDDSSFYWTNCFEKGERATVDIVLCNPPFHQGNTIGDFIAWQMFNDSARVLKKGGAIHVIGNRHLGYHVKLKRIFKNSKVIASNKKFVLIESIK